MDPRRCDVSDEPTIDPDAVRQALGVPEGWVPPSASQSKNNRAEQLMGRRASGVIAFDQPCEQGYRCPVCLVPALVDGDYDERLHWSEYAGFLWCEVCDRDYPSALCVDIQATPDPERPWVHAGPDEAVKVFLDTVAQAVARVPTGGTTPPEADDA